MIRILATLQGSAPIFAKVPRNKASGLHVTNQKTIDRSPNNIDRMKIRPVILRITLRKTAVRFFYLQDNTADTAEIINGDRLRALLQIGTGHVMIIVKVLSCKQLQYILTKKYMKVLHLEMPSRKIPVYLFSGNRLI
jgi:hypothetical protein